MKTIGYVDNVERKTIKAYFKKSPSSLSLFPAYKSQKCKERIIDALQELKHMGNISVYLINGKKTRFLFSKGF